MTQSKPLSEDRPHVVPVVNVREDGDGYNLTAELPAVADNGVQLIVEDRTLILDAANDVAPPEGYTAVRQEIPPVRFRAVFELPDRVDVGAIQSTLRNGVLTVALPKRDEVKPRRVPVVTG